MKVQLPWYGKATGSSAGTIYQSYWGNTYTRSFPFIFHYPNTHKQQETQSLFFAIQRNWWAVYTHLGEQIPPAMRKNKNVFNILSKGLYKSIMTYNEKKKSNVVYVWGLDTRHEVQLRLMVYEIKYKDNNYIIQADVIEIIAKRSFTPKTIHMLLYNCTQQLFFYQYQEALGSKIDMNFEVSEQWSDDDLIIAYVAFSDDDFMTNFYLCSK